MDSLAPSCPRCGYDLSGHAASWTDSCPLRDTCSECGLEFEWGDLLNASIQRIPGFVEHAKGFLATLIAAYRTWAWTILPSRFWARAGHAGPLRLGRAVLWLFVVVVGTWTAARALDALQLGIGLFVSTPGKPMMGTSSGSVVAVSVGLLGKVLRPDLGLRVSCDATASSPTTSIAHAALKVPWTAGIGTLSFPVMLMPVVVAMVVWPLTFMASEPDRHLRRMKFHTSLQACVYGFSWMVLPLLADLVFAIISFIRAAGYGFGAFGRSGGLSHWELIFFSFRDDEAWERIQRDHWLILTLCVFLWLIFWWRAADRACGNLRASRAYAVATAVALAVMLSMSFACVAYRNSYPEPNQWNWEWSGVNI